MPPRGLKIRNRGCFDMYMFIYRKKTGKMLYATISNTEMIGA